MEKLEVRSVIKFLWKSGKKNKEIVRLINGVNGEGAVSLRMVQKWTLRFRRGDTTIFDKIRSGAPKKEEIREKIEIFIKQCPYASAREIASTVECDKRTVSKILKNELGMNKVNIRWIPKMLTDHHKLERVRLAKEMLTVLTNQNQYKLVYTQDETWIYLQNPRKTMWVMSGMERPMVEKRQIGAKKLMISVIFNVNGIASVVVLPRGQIFNKRFFIDVVIDDFIKKVKIPKSRDEKRKVKLHCDNAPVHNIDEELRQLNIPRVPQPPYSPDLAPCDFYLFGHLKSLLEGKNFASDDQLVDEVQEILHSIPISTLHGVYDEWVQRLKKCIEIGGSYLE